LDHNIIFGKSYSECQQSIHAWLRDSFIVQLLTTVKRGGSDLNDSVSTASATCEHLQLDQPYSYRDWTDEFWFPNDLDKRSNEQYYGHLLDEPYTGED